MNHIVEEFSRNGQKVAVLGECHYKDSQTENLCNEIKSKYKTIGVENCPMTSFEKNLRGFIKKYIMLLRPDIRPSSRNDLDLIISFLKDLNQLDKVCPDIPHSVIQASLAKNIKVVDLEKSARADPYFSTEIVIVSLLVGFAANLIWLISFIKFCNSIFFQGVFLGEYIFTRELYVMVVLFIFMKLWTLPVTYKQGSYERRRRIFKYFPLSYILYYRDEIMAQTIINHQASGDMLVIVGAGHLEGIKYWLLKNNYTHIGTYTVAEFANK